MSRMVKVLLAAGVLFAAIAVALIFFPRGSNEPQADANGAGPAEEVELPPNPAAESPQGGTPADPASNTTASNATPPKINDAFKPSLSGDRFGSVTNDPSRGANDRFQASPSPGVGQAGKASPSTAAPPAVGAASPTADPAMVAIRRSPPAPLPNVREPIQHQVVDGDTLASLARKYWGTTDEYLRIYQANNTKLSSPDLLPIGTTLTIPPNPATTVARPAVGDDAEMVPIRRPPR